MPNAGITGSAPASISRPDSPLPAELEFYRQTFAHSIDALAVIGADGRYLLQNRAHRELTGYSDEELAGQTPAIHLGEQGFAEIGEALQSSGAFRGEVVSHTKGGVTRHLELAAFAVHGSRGELLGYVGIKRDISERKRAEEERAARIAELEGLYSVAGALSHATEVQEVYAAAIAALVGSVKAERASILIYDDNGVMRFKAWHGLSDDYRRAVDGHSPWRQEELNPAPIYVDDVITDPAMAPYREIVLSEGIRALGFIPITYEGRLLGKFMVYYNQPHVFTAPETRLAAAVAAHIAAAIQKCWAQEALRRSEKMAAAGRFAATIAHEINNPLEGIINLLYLLRGECPQSGAAAGYLEQIERELARISHVTRLTLGFYREGHERLDVNVKTLIDEVLSLYRPRLEAKQIAVRVEADSGTLRVVPGELRQVISNLVANAIDAVPNEGGTIAICASTGLDSIQLSVSDNGRGVAAEHIARIFEPFFTTKRDFGTGLGLAVSKEIIEKHGGTISLQTSTSGSDQGTTFTVWLPRSVKASTAA